MEHIAIIGKKVFIVAGDAPEELHSCDGCEYLNKKFYSASYAGFGHFKPEEGCQCRLTQKFELKSQHEDDEDMIALFSQCPLKPILDKKKDV